MGDIWVALGGGLQSTTLIGHLYLSNMLFHLGLLPIYCFG